MCYTMTCIGLCDISFRITLGISRSWHYEWAIYQQGYGVVAELTWDAVLIDLWDDRIRADHKEVLVLSLAI